ncbi:MAG TPA: hypothetical protein PK674_01110 [Candidatus Absconditabacterales bacterium]|nr:hypothetical protein [Candidatus Absconditabacterales bacterium]HOQ78805.1 hypothetical protein [Candidatus Absconditabacterales bacterium]HPK27925.1 hypothetical protein [Candidatus Absconditabacterales bacterium]
MLIEQRREEVAKEYIDNLKLQETDGVLKQIGDLLGLFKKEIEEKSKLTKDVEKKLQDFLVSGGLFSEFKGFFSRLLLPSEIQKKLENAKEVLKNSTNKQEAREKLGLYVNKEPETTVLKTENLEGDAKGGVEQNLDNENLLTDSKEYLKNFSEAERYIIEQAKKYGITDKNQIAYILATVKGESNFKNIKEFGGKNKRYGKDNYFGRGYVQLTHKSNYRKFTNIIRKNKLQFKDNFGNNLDKEDLNLVKNPDSILKSNDLAAFILIHGMKEGLFTGKKLSDFVNEHMVDFYNARNIVNGMSSSPGKFQNLAKKYLSQMEDKQKIIT